MRRRKCPHEEGDYHDCDYVDAISALVEVAWGNAWNLLKAEPVLPVSNDRYRQRRRVDLLFHEEMARLCEERGLRKRVKR